MLSIAALAIETSATEQMRLTHALCFRPTRINTMFDSSIQGMLFSRLGAADVRRPGQTEMRTAGLQPRVMSEAGRRTHGLGRLPV